MHEPEPDETNDLLCIVLRKSGGVDNLPNGKIDRGDSIPRNGDGYFIGDVECTVAGHAYTPQRPFTWTLLLIEN